MSRKKKLFINSLGRGMLILVIALSSIVLISWRWCEKPHLGTFGDTPVSGLNYTSGTWSRITSHNGYFSYTTGSSVIFSIGDLIIGEAEGARTLTALDIIEGATDASDPSVNNILVLLQTLDKDGDLNNGVQITQTIRNIVSGHAGSINFNQTTQDFSSNLSDLMTELNNAKAFSDTYRGPRQIRDAEKALALFQRNTGPRITVKTRKGRLKGFESNANTWQWIGVPYAKPPVDKLRWRSPKNFRHWKGTRQATEWGDQAAQPIAYTAGGFGGVSENCLSMNITAPKNAKNLPVMVWFHGGAFGILTANTSAYNNPTSLTTKGIIQVTVNHRLGAFGYLAHPELTEESRYDGSGNYGQMDLIMALKWIKKNIAAFGGNPKNVTIFGQSGGGGKAISLMSSPLAKGLFHKAICQSGIAVANDGVLNAGSLAVAEAKGSDLSARLGGLTIDEMRKLPWQDIINTDLFTYGAQAWLIYGPNIDNYYSTDTMENIIKNGLPSDVPFLAGANSFDRVAGADLALGVTQQMPWRSDYNNADQFIYYWDYVPPGWDAMNVGAYHGLELIYVFNSSIPSFIVHYGFGLVLDKDTGLPPTIPPYTPDPNANILISTGYYSPMPPYPSAESMTLSNNVMTIWTNFAKTGNPSASGVIDNWPVYTTNSDAYIEIGTGGTFTPQTGVETAFGTP